MSFQISEALEQLEGLGIITRKTSSHVKLDLEKLFEHGFVLRYECKNGRVEFSTVKDFTLTCDSIIYIHDTIPISALESFVLIKCKMIGLSFPPGEVIFL